MKPRILRKLQRVARSQKATDPSVELASRTSSPQLGDRMAKITLVDDDENIVASVSMALESHGHTVKAYYDGVSGLAALEAEPPDLAILDVKMPRMDGMEVLRRLRQTSEMPVIILTSKDEEIDEILGFNLGADDLSLIHI